VKRLNQESGRQLNLPLRNDAAAAVPEGAQKELALALVELLISGFRETSPSPRTGGGDDPEAYL
jgi:hypothetical protein